MLYVIDTKWNEHQWHVGEKFPDVDSNDIFEIRADGDELTFVQTLLDDHDLEGRIPRYPSDHSINIHRGETSRTQSWRAFDAFVVCCLLVSKLTCS